MPIEGVDYAWDRPDIQGLANVGKKFACRYVGPGSAGKHLDPTEAWALATAGLSIVANAEGTDNGLLGGRSVGMAWALQGHDHAVRCGMPPWRPIYLSVDFDVNAGQWPKVRDALDGAREVLGPDRVGVYGGYDAIAWAQRDGVATWFWQTLAWSEGRWHPAAMVHQYRNGVSLVGGTVDLNRAMVSDYGQWRPVGSSGGSGEEDMPLSNADIDKVAEAVRVAIWKDVITDDTNEQSAGRALWVARQHAKAANDRLSGVAEIPAAVELSAKMDTLADASAELKSLLTPVVDPVALATALAAHPDFAAALAAQVANRLGRIVGELTLTGSADLGIRPDTG